MQLHTLSIPRQQQPKRIARGGKRGTTSGRGQKGQKSRSGHRIRPALRDLISRIPKKRGFANNPTSAVVAEVNLSFLNRALAKEPMTTITPATLRQLGLVPARHRGPIKLLGTGSITVAIAVEGCKVSEAAQKKIEAVGGTIA